MSKSVFSTNRESEGGVYPFVCFLFVYVYKVRIMLIVSSFTHTLTLKTFKQYT